MLESTPSRRTSTLGMAAGTRGLPLPQQPIALRHLLIVRCLVLGLALACLQTLFATALAAFVSETPYLALVRWDGWLYQHIAEHGYRSTLPPVRANMDLANVAFFPGYPVTAGYISRWTGLSPGVSLLLTAQLAAAVFWSYFLLLLTRWKVAGRITAAAVTAVIVHPAAFFLVAAYSESMFLAALLGFVYWSQGRGILTWALAALHGFVMTATRVAGLPLVMYPVFDAIVFAEAARSSLPWERIKAAARRCLPCLMGAAGGLAFFAFCHFALGQWNLYFETQRIGWNVAPDYAALFKLKNYYCFGALAYDWVRWPDDLSRFSLASTLGCLLVPGLVELRYARAGRAQTGRRERVMLYLMAAAILYIHAAGVSSRHMTSLIRYAFGCHALFVLTVANFLHNRQQENAQQELTNSPPGNAALWLLAAAALVIQAAFILRFAANQWVA